jgi:hypothetical protein
MTEADWLACTDPQKMLEFLQDKASGRKLRLFACACCRRVWPLLVDRQSREAVEVAELYAEGEASDENLASARDAALRTYLTSPPGTASYRAAAAAFYATRGPVRLAAGNAAGATAGLVPAFGGQEQADLLRCMLGRLFARGNIPEPWLSWNEGTIPKLARVIYDGGIFDLLPVLADALEKAGCQDQDILDHCRSGGEHVRGCWVIDLLLGKS